MKARAQKACFSLIIPVALIAFSTLAQETRTWTFSQDGKTEGSGVWSFRKGGRMDGDFVRMQGDNSVVLRSTDGQERIVPVGSLSQKDRDYVWQASRPAYHVEKEEQQQEAKPTEEAATEKRTAGSSTVTAGTGSSSSHSPSTVRSKRSNSSDKPKKEHVSSYTKKDGTHVNSYNRRPPH